MYNDSTSSKVYNTYNLIFKEFADPRTDGWLFFGHPFGLIVIIAIYLYTVCIRLPNYMKNRKAYDIKGLVQVYNIFQILACGSLVYGLLSNGWTIQYTLQPMDYSSNPKNLRILYICWFNYVLKLVDLIETVFFVLRKKQTQVTKLHLYHHVSTLLFGWLITKYAGAAASTFTIILNNAVHVIMYSYYLLSTLGPKIQQKILLFKSKITMVQMIQFCLLAIHTLAVMKYNDIPILDVIGYLFIINLLINFAMFLNFYMRRYKKSKVL